MRSFEFQSRTRLIFGAGSIARLGEVARELGFSRTLIVSDHGLIDAGHVARASDALDSSGISVSLFHDFDSNPMSSMVERGRVFADKLSIDSIIGLGGGSSLDTAKGINFVLTNGGTMRDYWGYGKTTRPMLPMIGIPTTAGTGSDAQSYALISDDETHAKMACGDPQAAFRVALLDPELTVSQPRIVTASSGYDAIAHAVEAFMATKRTPVSDMLSREAWRLLESNLERVLEEPNNIEARGAMQLGAFYAGLAIENSMLGATHACANPLTAQFGIEHGIAIALMLPQVVRWNASVANDRYVKFAANANQNAPKDTGALADRLERLRATAGLPSTLGELGVTSNDIDSLAVDAAQQWTGQFNPRPFDAIGAREIYQSAL